MSTTVSLTLSPEALRAAITHTEAILAAYKAALAGAPAPKKVSKKAAAADAVPDAEVASETGSRKANKNKGVPRGSSGWNLFTAHVRAEMIAASPDTKPKVPEVTAEAKRRKDAGEYDEAHWKAAAATKKKSASVSAASSDAEEAAPAAKPAAKKKAEPATPAKPTKPAKTDAPKKAAAAAPPPPPAEEEDDDEATVSEWIFNGNKVFKSSDNEIWASEKGAPGVFLGIYDPLTNRINPPEDEDDE
jgi:hypothetical protein